MKIYSITLLGALILSGCSWCCQEPEPCDPEIIIKTKIVNVDVPVKCEIKKIHCDFSGEGFIPTTKLLECVVTQKKALSKCTKEK